ncbi:glycolipid 2-alpha-mannosyltransferase-domain-containing protein [Gongronella butleri]|nr:glycolipid 2-alpha-mannosyltransferase-domain-containing protein [Gongronella butleri]
MRPFSRKPILLLAFVSVLTFLYYVASHPRVSKTMQPNAYYNNYDERVCLPDHHIRLNPPPVKAKAAIVSLVRNSELDGIVASMHQLEDRFNKNFHYPYVFLNEEPFTEEFKIAMRKAAPSSKMEFGLIDKPTQWSVPSFVDRDRMDQAFTSMRQDNVMYGDMESYHHMCRYQSGFFFDHPLLANFDWYWRLEPGVKFYCDITYDPFLYMEKHNKQYGFVITLRELSNTIPTLWQTVLEYAKSRHIDISDKNNLLFPYFVNKKTGDYNMCHFWSNFEIASLNLWRSPQYRDFFNYLDKTGNFFYERWGDAPVHSIGAGLFLSTDQVHYFEDIGYQHDLYRHCPTKRSNLGCNCVCPSGTNSESIDHDSFHDTCLPAWRKWVKTAEARKGWGWSS